MLVIVSLVFVVVWLFELVGGVTLRDCLGLCLVFCLLVVGVVFVG